MGHSGSKNQSLSQKGNLKEEELLKLDQELLKLLKLEKWLRQRKKAFQVVGRASAEAWRSEAPRVSLVLSASVQTLNFHFLTVS